MAGNFVKKYAQENQPLLKKLLVIDDEQTQLDEHCKAMWYLGYNAVPFLVTGNMTLGAVLRAIHLQKPDGILTDWQMTACVSGEQIGEMIKMGMEFGDLPAIPVILHTGADIKWVRENAEAWKNEYGLQGVFKKGSHCGVDEVFSAYFEVYPEVSYDRTR
jgi:CheY-like chemotaxis protein